MNRSNRAVFYTVHETIFDDVDCAVYDAVGESLTNDEYWGVEFAVVNAVYGAVKVGQSSRPLG